MRRTKGQIFKEMAFAFERDLRARIVEPRIREMIRERAEAQSKPAPTASTSASTYSTPAVLPPSMNATTLSNRNTYMAHPLPPKPGTPQIPSSVSPPQIPSPIMSPPRPSTPQDSVAKSDTPDVGATIKEEPGKEGARRVLPSFTKRRPRSPPPTRREPDRRPYSPDRRAYSPDRRLPSPERSPVRPPSRTSLLRGQGETDSVFSESIRDDTSESSSLRNTTEKTSVDSQPALQVLQVLPYVEPARKLSNQQDKSKKSGKKVVVFTSSEEQDDEDDTVQLPLIVRPLPTPRKEVEFTSSSEEEAPARKQPVKKKPAAKLKATKGKGKAKANRSEPATPFLAEETAEWFPSPLITLGNPDSDTATPATPGFFIAPPVRQPKKIVIPEGTEVDPFAVGLASDDEDLFYLHKCLQRWSEHGTLHPEPRPVDEDEEGPVHQTGAARTEGYYKIPAAQKSAYLPQRNRAMVDRNRLPDAISVSRNARAQTRRLVVGIEQQRSKTAAVSNDVLMFNQLRARKKQLKFARSRIRKPHWFAFYQMPTFRADDWGLYAMEYIPAGDLIVEYVGEYIRQQIADRRERQYELMGIGSSYLFRVDDDFVVDATKKGSMRCVFAL